MIKVKWEFYYVPLQSEIVTYLAIAYNLMIFFLIYLNKIKTYWNAKFELFWFQAFQEIYVLPIIYEMLVSLLFILLL